jgi:hypothetical protein
VAEIENCKLRIGTRPAWSVAGLKIRNWNLGIEIPGVENSACSDGSVGPSEKDVRLEFKRV